MKDLISIQDLSKEEVVALLDRAAELKAKPPGPLLQGKLMASCFFEPSTRTRLSFEAAMRRLGGEVIGFSSGTSSSAQKGESLHDAMRVIGSYTDVIVIRHPLEGSARQAAEATETPVLNGGDGANEHPTQTLLDLFTIRECQGKLEGLNIAFAGDLKHGRTVHSLAKGLKHFSPRLFFIAPPGLEMPSSLCDRLKMEGVPFSFHTDVREVVGRLDILYMTRLQKERFEGSYANFTLTPETLHGAKETLKVLHPLPRVDEITQEVDKTPHAYYFEQAENGLYIRQALLERVLT